MNVIDVTDLLFSYNGSEKSTFSLRIPQLKIGSGERVFLQGESGSGKTTLLGLLGGLLKPSGGSLQILGYDFSKVSGFTRDKVRGEKMGIIFQMFNLIPYLSVRENILLPCKFFSERRNKIKSVSLMEEVERLAQSLSMEAHLDSAVSELSVGQQQRVAVARALIGAPPLIIADEPTSALDIQHRDLFMKLLIQEVERSGSSLLFVSHDPQLKSYFNRVLNITDWKVEKN